MRTWFITGCSTGFGKLLTHDRLAVGDTVIATARKAEDLERLRAEAPEGGTLHTLLCDVTDQDQVRVAIATALTYTGRLDVLVNNAGYGYFATQEEASLDEIRAMYEVNVFGLIRVTQGWLPHLRAQGGATIVNLSSVAGRLASPRGGYYQSSKWAVEAMSQALFLETSRFGIKVRVIEPGSYATDFGPRSAKVQPSLKDGTSAYAAWTEEWLAAMNQIFKYGGQDPMEVVRAITDSVDAPEGFLRVPVGRDTLDYLELRALPDDQYFAKLRELGFCKGPGE